MDIQHHDGTESLLVCILSILLYAGGVMMDNLAVIDKLTSILMHIICAGGVLITTYYAIKNRKKKK